MARSSKAAPPSERELYERRFALQVWMVHLEYESTQVRMSKLREMDPELFDAVCEHIAKDRINHVPNVDNGAS